MIDGELKKAATKYIQWLQQEALPLWAEKGMRAEGGHFERLNADGEPDLSSIVRVRVQARQIYTFAQAYQKGWCVNGLALAEGLLVFCEHSARAESASQGYIHTLTPDFTPLDTKIDLYDHAFFLLAYAALFSASGDTQYLQRAEQLWQWLDTRLKNPYGGWLEGDYPAEYRRQNPHMHLFEAFLSLYEASQNAAWLRPAEDILLLFKQHFFDKNFGVVREFFKDDWQTAAGEAGRAVEPGHSLEWVWLLHKYESLTGQDMSAWVKPLYKQAYKIGFAQSGLMYDVTDLDGSLLAQTKRTWPMTEAIKANISQAKAGVKGSEQRAADAINTLFKYYLSVPVCGSWIDLRGEQDEIANHFAPASTFYHLMCAGLEVSDYLEMH